MKAQSHVEKITDVVARAELAAVKSQLGFFIGSYADALSDAEFAQGAKQRGLDDERHGMKSSQLRTHVRERYVRTLRLLTPLRIGWVSFPRGA